MLIVREKHYSKRSKSTDCNPNQRKITHTIDTVRGQYKTVHTHTHGCMALQRQGIKNYRSTSSPATPNTVVPLCSAFGLLATVFTPHPSYWSSTEPSKNNSREVSCSSLRCTHGPLHAAQPLPWPHLPSLLGPSPSAAPALPLRTHVLLSSGWPGRRPLLCARVRRVHDSCLPRLRTWF